MGVEGRDSMKGMQALSGWGGPGATGIFGVLRGLPKDVPRLTKTLLDTTFRFLSGFRWTPGTQSSYSRYYSQVDSNREEKMIFECNKYRVYNTIEQQESNNTG